MIQRSGARSLAVQAPPVIPGLLVGAIVLLVAVTPLVAAPLGGGDRIELVHKQIAKQRYDRAIREIDRILEVDPTHLEAWILRGEVALMRADLQDALDSWRIASDLSPDDADLLIRIGDLLIRRDDDLDEALEVYTRALAIDPAQTRVLVSMGAIHERRQRWDHAAEAYRRALAIDPNLLRARSSLGAVLFKTGRFREAGAELRKAIELSPTDLRSRVFLGLSQNHLGQYEVALQELKEGVRIDPHSANQLIGMREQEVQFGHLIGIFTRAFEASPREAGRSFDLAVIHYYAHDYESAWKHLIRAEQLRYPIPMTFKEVVYSKRRLQRDAP